MKSIVTIAAAGMLVVGLAEPAAAFRFSPARTHFVAAGPARYRSFFNNTRSSDELKLVKLPANCRAFHKPV